MIRLAPDAVAVKHAVLAGHVPLGVDAEVMIGAVALAPMFVGELIVKVCSGRPVIAPVELSMAVCAIVVARLPGQVTETRTRLRSSGWLSAGEVGVLAEQKVASVVPRPSFGSSIEHTEAVTA